MGTGDVNPLEQLKALVDQIERAPTLESLKPIYFQLNEIVQKPPDDFDIQLAGSEIKDRLLARGRQLKKQQESAPAPPPISAEPTVEMPPPAPVPLAAPIVEPEKAAPVRHGWTRKKTKTSQS